MTEQEHKIQLQAAVSKERERCAAIVQAARFGDIDTDFRTLVHFIEDGTDIAEFLKREET